MDTVMFRKWMKMESSESSAQKSRKEQKRKERPRKPQFSLNFQYDFGEEDEMKRTQERFARLQNKVKVWSGRANADFFQALLGVMQSQKIQPCIQSQCRLVLQRPFFSFMLSANGQTEKLLRVDSCCRRLRLTRAFLCVRIAAFCFYWMWNAIFMQYWGH